MKKKLLCLLVTAIAVLTAQANISRKDYQAIVDGSTPVEGIRYVFNDETLTATVATIDSLMPDSIMHIPETVSYEGKTYTVTAIGDNAFGYGGSVFNKNDRPWCDIMRGLKRIIVPKTVKRIGAGAFHNTGWKGNTAATSLFDKNSPLEDIYFEEDSQLEEVGENAFGGPNVSSSNMNHLVTKIAFAEGLKTIPARCFYNCENIASFTVPASVERIGNEAFCHERQVGYKDSNGNTEYKNFNIDIQIANLTEIGENAFGGYVQFYFLRDDINFDLKTVPANILMGNKAVKYVRLSAQVEHIGANAFASSTVSSIYCDAAVPPTVDATALPSQFSASVPYSFYEVYLQADAWKDHLSNEWTMQDNGLVDNYRYSTYYRLTYPDKVEMVSCDMHAEAVLLADSVEYEGHRFAVQPEIPEGIFYDSRYYNSNYANTYLRQIVIKTPSTRLPKLFAGDYYHKYYDDRDIVRMSALRKIQLPDSLKEIADGAFRELVIVRNYNSAATESEQRIDINIPKNVETIGDEAFYGISLMNLTLPEGLKSVGKRAFYGHFSETVSLPASLEQIGEDAFFTDAYEYADNYRVRHITVADGNQRFKMVDNALYTMDGKRLLLCTAEKTGDLVLPEGLTQTDEHAFEYLVPTALHIPASLTKPTLIQEIVTGNMSNIDVAAANPVYKSIDGVLFNHAADTLLRYPSKKALEEYTVPASVVVLGERSMTHTQLKKINLLNTLREMREYALAYNNFKEIRLPDSLRYMYGYALGECNGLRSVTFPDSVRLRALQSGSGYYSGGVLGGCKNLRTVRFSGYLKYASPSFVRGQLTDEHYGNTQTVVYNVVDRETYDSLMVLSANNYSSYYAATEYDNKYIKLVCDDDYAQLDGVEYHRERPAVATVINALPSVIPQLSIPEKVTIGGEECRVSRITNEAFQGNTDVVTLSLPASVDTIGHRDSTWVYSYDETLGRSVYSMHYYINSNSAFSGMAQLKSFSINKSFGQYFIGNYQFADCPKLESITWPDGVDSLGAAAFRDDSMLVSLNFTFSPALKELPLATFMNCVSLKSMSLPAISAIGDAAFAYCEQLSDITIADGYNTVTLGTAPFFGCKELTRLPAAERLQWKYDRYNQLEGCLKLADYTPATIGTVAVDTIYYGSARYVTSVKDNAMVNEFYRINTSDPEAAPELMSRSLISYPAGCTAESYAIADGVTTIEAGAFLHSQFARVTVPASVKYIHDGSFAFNSQLKEIILQGEEPATLSLYAQDGEFWYAKEHVLRIGMSNNANDIIVIGSMPFEQEVFDNAVLYVPDNAVDTYRSANGWNLFRNIRTMSELTGIELIDVQKQSNISKAVYDLQGRRVSRSTMQKGLYIVDGKKVMIQ